MRARTVSVAVVRSLFACFHAFYIVILTIAVWDTLTPGKVIFGQPADDVLFGVVFAVFILGNAGLYAMMFRMQKLPEKRLRNFFLCLIPVYGWCHFVRVGNNQPARGEGVTEDV